MTNIEAIHPLEEQLPIKIRQGEFFEIPEMWRSLSRDIKDAPGKNKDFFKSRKIEVEGIGNGEIRAEITGTVNLMPRVKIIINDLDEEAAKNIWAECFNLTDDVLPAPGELKDYVGKLKNNCKRDLGVIIPLTVRISDPRIEKYSYGVFRKSETKPKS